MDHCWKKHPNLKAECEAKRAVKGTKSQGRQRPGKVTPESHVKKPVLKVDFVLGLRQARLCTVQLTDAEPIWLRDPQPGNRRRPRKGLILSGAYTTDNTPENVLRGIATLIDSGAMYWPLRGGKMFHAIHYTKAEFPIRLVGAGKNRLAGGSQVVKCSVTLPVWHDGRYVTVKCAQVTVHLAFVGPRVILGYPFLARYGLTLRMLTRDQNGRPIGYFAPWSDHTLFLHPKEPEISGIVKKCRWNGARGGIIVRLNTKEIGSGLSGK